MPEMLLKQPGVSACGPYAKKKIKIKIKRIKKQETLDVSIRMN